VNGNLVCPGGRKLDVFLVVEVIGRSPDFCRRQEITMKHILDYDKLSDKVWIYCTISNTCCMNYKVHNAMYCMHIYRITYFNMKVHKKFISVAPAGIFRFAVIGEFLSFGSCLFVFPIANVKKVHAIPLCCLQMRNC
jgi:hypothetical protein